jgi:hypothetical protein
MSLGKISRLPKHVREQLNRRLENNEPYAGILPWLNARKCVRFCTGIVLMRTNWRDTPLRPPPAGAQSLRRCICGPTRPRRRKINWVNDL